MIDKKTVKHVAKLARIDLNDEEIKKFSQQLSKVFDHIETLSEVNTENVEPTSQVTGLENVMREDEVKEPQAKPKDLLACSELPIDSDQVRVIKVI